MVDERSSLTAKVYGKIKNSSKGVSYGSTVDQKDVDINSKQKYRKLRFLKKLWRWNSVKKTKEELLEEGQNIEPNKQVTLVTYAFCFIMMIAGLSVKMDRA